MHSSPVITHLFRGNKKEVLFKGKPVETAIFKEPLTTAVRVNMLGVEADEQADLKHHGGIDKALCFYLEESYKYWNKYSDKNISAGSFGENIVLSNIKEDDVYIGDIYKVGEVQFQISQPRQPCFKLGIRNDWPEMLVISRNSGYTGFYARIIQKGQLAPLDQVILIHREQHSLSIKVMNHLLYGQNVNEQQLNAALAIQSLAESCRKDLSKRLEKLKV